MIDVAAVQQLMEEVGTYLQEVQKTVTPESKGVDNPVSEADREAERRLKKELVGIRPGSLFRGEELGWSQWPADSECWVVDPLDGTAPYLEGSEKWGISVALFKGHRQVFGAMFFPSLGEFYWAAPGKGAFLNGEPLRVKESNTVVLSERKKRLLEQQGFDAFILRSEYGSTFSCSLVAKGEAAAYLQFQSNHTSEWDVNAASLIVVEAGGQVSDIRGELLSFNKKDPIVPNVLISNKAVHDEVLRTLRQKGL